MPSTKPHLAGATIERAADLTAAHIDDEMVVMQIGTGMLYQFDSVATRIWDLLETKPTVEGLVESLRTEFEVAADDCRADLVELLDDLAMRGVIRITPAR